MSHQTGIQPNDELRSFFKKYKSSSKIRVAKISIKSEQLILDESKESSSSKWDEDYVKYINRLVLDKQPCFLLLRFDTKNPSTGLFEWMLINWTPEGSPVREKMLYASTKASLKKDFGSSSIVIDYFSSCQEEISLPSLKSYLNRKKLEENGQHDDNLLSIQEQDLRIVKKEEAASTRSKPTQTLPGVEFPLTSDALDALNDLKDGLISYLQLTIDMRAELIQLSKKESHKDFDIKDLPTKIPCNSPGYHLILYPHNFDGIYHKSVIFIYSVPGSSTSVKERMLYSSCKSSLMSAIQTKIGLEVHKKLEVDDPTELTTDYLLDQLHPKPSDEATLNSNKNSFEKPKGPAGKRGIRRLIKWWHDEQDWFTYLHRFGWWLQQLVYTNDDTHIYLLNIMNEYLMWLILRTGAIFCLKHEWNKNWTTISNHDNQMMDNELNILVWTSYIYVNWKRRES